VKRAAGLVIAASLLVSGCAPRVIIATGTTLGIKATPGDGQTRPPQVVIGYKRAEAALIPVEGGGAEMNGFDVKTDAASTVASFYLKSQWTAGTEIRSFIGSGFAARHIVSESFAKEFARAALSNLPTAIVDQREYLADLLRSLDGNEAKAAAVLRNANLQPKTDRNAVQSLRVYILDATTQDDLDTLKKAFASAGIQ
jgi:hypothetical protein